MTKKFVVMYRGTKSNGVCFISIAVTVSEIGIVFVVGVRGVVKNP